MLPFANLSDDREQDYFADGIVAEIITGLSRIKWLFVISRNSTFIYKGRPVDVKTVGRDLGVRYVLEGSVRRSGDHVRVIGQLIETETATHVWADRYDGTLGDIFALQDAMTMSVIGAVEPTLRRAEVERARRKRPDSLDAYDLFLRALPFAATAMPEDADKALPLLEAAIRLEPDYAAAHGFIAWCHEQRYLRGGLHAETRELARRHAHAAIEAGGDDAMALAMGGFVVGVVERDYRRALEALDRSLALSPSSALAFGFSSIIRAWMGDYSDRDRARQDGTPPQPLRSVDLPALRRPGLRPLLRRRLRGSRQRRRPGFRGQPPVQRAPLPARGGPLPPRPDRRGPGRSPRSCSTCSPASPSAAWSPATSPPRNA